MVRVCREESFRQRQGFGSLLTMMTRSGDGRGDVQDAVGRWWPKLS
jgi:1,2-phenylacetyl-CoA epoxidase catalytic subunit